ncbi:MAG: hypothetical protein R3D35_02925 [Nitratireductor sp.]
MIGLSFVDRLKWPEIAALFVFLLCAASNQIFSLSIGQAGSMIVTTERVGGLEATTNSGGFALVVSALIHITTIGSGLMSLNALATLFREPEERKFALSEPTSKPTVIGFLLLLALAVAAQLIVIVIIQIANLSASR